MNGDRRWPEFFLFLQCYVLAILITASFDVALEGPILGILVLVSLWYRNWQRYDLSSEAADTDECTFA